MRIKTVAGLCEFCNEKKAKFMCLKNFLTFVRNLKKFLSTEIKHSQAPKQIDIYVWGVFYLPSSNARLSDDKEFCGTSSINVWCANFEFFVTLCWRIKQHVFVQDEGETKFDYEWALDVLYFDVVLGFWPYLILPYLCSSTITKK